MPIASMPDGRPVGLIRIILAAAIVFVIAATIVCVLLVRSLGPTISEAKTAAAVKATATAADIDATSIASYAAREVAPETKAAQAEMFADFCRKQILAYDPKTQQPDLTACLFAGDAYIGPDDDFSGFDFTGATLTNATLIGATFAGTRFVDADLVGARLSHERVFSNFTNADFTGASLTYAHLPSANLAGTNFADADLRGAFLYGRDSTGEIAYRAIVTGVIWDNSTCPDGTNSDDHDGTCINNLIVD